MSETVYFFILSAIMFLMAVITPKVLKLRIRVLRFMHWNWFADWHQRNFAGFVIAARIILVCIGFLLLYFGLTGSRGSFD